MNVKAVSRALPGGQEGEGREGRGVQDDPDNALVAAAQADPARFLALYDRYFPRIHGYVRLRVRDAATCEDVTSQIFTTALSRIGDFRRGGSFGAWLFRIAQNTVYDLYRKRREEHIDEAMLGALPDAETGPEEQALAAERAARLRALVGALRPEQQHIIALRYGAGLSMDEIGRIVDKSAVNVRVSLHRALHELRRRYPYDD